MAHQKKFEAEPNNLEFAYKYLRVSGHLIEQELNRHGKYLTVIRLFNKHETEFFKNTKDSFLEKINDQYEYAKDNTESLGKVKSSQSKDARMKGESSTLTQHMINKSFEFVTKIIYLGAFAIVAMLIFKNFDQKSLYESYKFDIKRAKDIDQRLDDVKGIDEIKEEIENVIKMI